MRESKTCLVAHMVWIACVAPLAANSDIVEAEIVLTKPSSASDEVAGVSQLDSSENGGLRRVYAWIKFLPAPGEVTHMRAEWWLKDKDGERWLSGWKDSKAYERKVSHSDRSKHLPLSKRIWMNNKGTYELRVYSLREGQWHLVADRELVVK